MEFSKEQIEKARSCKTLEEFKELAKAEGLKLSEEEAENYFAMTREGELTDDELTSVAGGAKGEKWIPIRTRYLRRECPFCGHHLEMKAEILVSSKTGQRDKRLTPNKCPCGADIDYSWTTNNYVFRKNGEIRP